MNYETAKKKKQILIQLTDVASKKLREFPRKENGLTPDEIKFSQEYQNAKYLYDLCANKEKKFNKWFLKEFKNEYKQERITKCSQITKN